MRVVRNVQPIGLCCLQDVQALFLDLEYVLLTSGLILHETVLRMAELRGWSREKTS